MIERSRSTPDTDRDRFNDRAVWLATTIGGAGRLTGDLTGPAARRCGPARSARAAAAHRPPTGPLAPGSGRSSRLSL